jgi:hypothetical protein
MSLMLALATRYRRPTTVALGIVAGLCLLLVATALWNPWRLTALYPVASTGGAIAVLTLAGALVAMAGLFRLAETGRRALIGLVVGLVAVPALCVGAPIVAFDGAFRDRKVTAVRVLATSPDGGYSIVVATLPAAAGDDAHVELLVRSRRLLLSREAATPIAECPRDPVHLRRTARVGAIHEREHGRAAHRGHLHRHRDLRPRLARARPYGLHVRAVTRNDAASSLPRVEGLGLVKGRRGAAEMSR